MEQEFWHRCWQKSQLGFHQLQIQPLLNEYFLALNADERWHRSHSNKPRVFVPLCGKSLDLLFLAQYAQVVGNELSEIACRDFFSDNGLSCRLTSAEPFTVYEHADIRLYQGDFFALDANSFDDFDWLYDRAALIAWPESMQRRYVDKLSDFIAPNTRLLLLTLEFAQSEMAGPPFAVTEQRLRQLFSDFKVVKHAQRALTDKVFAQRRLPLSQVTECLYIISR